MNIEWHQDQPPSKYQQRQQVKGCGLELLVKQLTLKQITVMT